MFRRQSFRDLAFSLVEWVPSFCTIDCSRVLDRLRRTNAPLSPAALLVDTMAQPVLTALFDANAYPGDAHPWRVEHTGSPTAKAQLETLLLLEANGFVTNTVLTEDHSIWQLTMLALSALKPVILLKQPRFLFLPQEGSKLADATVVELMCVLSVFRWSHAMVTGSDRKPLAPYKGDCNDLVWYSRENATCAHQLA